ncbi:MAG TPA: PBP1A family penicillin-binding protein [Thermoanaerobaculia bacterium]|jgi:penicillin-binding protein 1B|nr:PBP1A family penicillin-binding protein [Thermoanaerobaculia bacterium]
MHPRLRRTVYILGGTLAVFFLVTVWLLFPYLRAFGDIGAGPENAPSRLYGAAPEVRLGMAATPRSLAAELDEMGYPAAAGEPLPPGRYRVGDDVLVVRLRRHMTPHGPVRGQLLLIRFRRGEVADLRLDGQPAERAELEAPVLATYYGEEAREKWPVRVRDLPEHVVQAVLAAEDAAFYWHPGVSPTGIARALFVNLRRGAVTQGGSTLTQQLVKNAFLTSERSLFRKIREAVIAVAVEVHHTKRSILQGYLNGIYLGGAGGIQYYGLGTAARAYFGKDATELTLEEAALLAGMIKSPAWYSPLAHPERARQRRNEVLRRMAGLEWIDAARLQRALAAPVETSPMRLGDRPAPHFADAMAAEARERFGLSRLGNRGRQLFSTLSLPNQRIAREAVADVLGQLDRRGRRGAEPLEAALLSVDPHTGAILAYVGGRDFSRSEFDRVTQAHRQAGSCFKPIVLVAGLESGRISPATKLRDEPLTLGTGVNRWTPRNADGTFRGWITARTALEQSRNVPLIRLAMDVGLDKVAATARRMGIDSEMTALPALALGAAEVTPREVATVYSTLANGGVRPALHGLSSVIDADGNPVPERRPQQPERVLTPQVAFIATAVLQGVVERGTARGVRRYGIPGPLAGKTGTTNEARDSWFAGYRPDRVTVVWVGRDNPGATTLSGARAALPIWGRYMKAALRDAPPAEFVEPPGLEHAVLCRESGLLARSDCPSRIAEVFLPGQKPTQVCNLEHAPAIDPRGFGLRFSDWLRNRLGRILGGEANDGGNGSEEEERPEEESPPP